MEPTVKQAFQFGKHLISRNQTFLVTRLSYAFTNRKPVLPGHVLVSTIRPVARFADLTTEEVADLFGCAHRIAPILQTLFKSSSLTIALQDGEHAGQTVDHVHVHLIPRRLGDFKQNDDIYHELESHDTRGHISSDRASNESEFRTMEEMVKEAAMLATYFPDGGV